jgi:hypothetical protein
VAAANKEAETSAERFRFFTNRPESKPSFVTKVILTRDRVSYSRSPTGNAAKWIEEPDTLRRRLPEMPIKHPYDGAGVSTCRVEAITNLEKS